MTNISRYPINVLQLNSNIALALEFRHQSLNGEGVVPVARKFQLGCVWIFHVLLNHIFPFMLSITSFINLVSLVAVQSYFD